MNVKNYNSVIPENIVRIIKSKGLKQSYVAEKAGYSRQQFSDMLNGRKIIKPCDAIAISNVLNVTMNDIYATEKGE